MSMSAQRQLALLDGCSSTAKKIFDCVPIESPWTLNEIYSEVTRLNLSVAFNACYKHLRTLVEAGIVREPKPDTFIRASVKPVKPMKPENKQSNLIESGSEPVKEESSFDALVSIASRLRDLANEIDSVALKVNAAAEADNDEMQKLRQLKSILKSIA